MVEKREFSASDFVGEINAGAAATSSFVCVSAVDKEENWCSRLVATGMVMDGWGTDDFGRNNYFMSGSGEEEGGVEPVSRPRFLWGRRKISLKSRFYQVYMMPRSFSALFQIGANLLDTAGAP